MEVILRENVPGLGSAGSKVKAKDGYARNYLFPRNLAVAVTPQNMKALEREQKIKVQKLDREKKEAEQFKTKIEQLSITLSVLTQDQDKDKLYGSVTSQEIHKALIDEGVEIDKNIIILDEPIKSLGVYEIPVKLHPEVTAILKVGIVKK